MKTFFEELFEYSNHFNTKLIEVFLAHPDKISEKSVALFSHILNAHQIWNSRIEPNQIPYGVWVNHQPQEFSKIAKMNYENSLLILKKYDLDDTIQYKMSTGKAFSNSVKDILFQIINHTTYHRGQIALEFKQDGIDPLLTDYIFYKR